MRSDITTRSIESLKEIFDSKLGEYYFEFTVDEKMLKTSVIPML